MKPIIQFLSDQEVRILHNLALQILNEIGMYLPHEEALELMSQNGAEVVDGDIVRFPKQLVQTAIETSPKRKVFEQQEQWILILRQERNLGVRQIQNELKRIYDYSL